MEIQWNSIYNIEPLVSESVLDDGLSAYQSQVGTDWNRHGSWHDSEDSPYVKIPIGWSINMETWSTCIWQSLTRTIVVSLNNSVCPQRSYPKIQYFQTWCSRFSKGASYFRGGSRIFGPQITVLVSHQIPIPGPGIMMLGLKGPHVCTFHPHKNPKMKLVQLLFVPSWLIQKKTGLKWGCLVDPKKYGLKL